MTLAKTLANAHLKIKPDLKTELHRHSKQPPAPAAYRPLVLLFLTGMEYHIRELADFRLPHLVMHLVDGAGQKEVCHDHVSLYGILWGSAHCAPVHLELPDTAACTRPLPQEGGALSGTGLQGRTRQWRVSVYLSVSESSYYDE